MAHTPEGQCLGSHEFAYALMPPQGAWDSNQAAVLREAQAFNTPLNTRAIVNEEHDGQQPAQATLVQVEPSELVVSAIKRSNDGNGLIVRVYNPLTHEITATLRPNPAYTQASLTNLLEEKVTDIALTEQSIRINIRGNSIVTLSLT